MRPNPEGHFAIARLAARQQGNVTRTQLLELGVGPGAIKYRTRVGLLHRAYAGVYGVGRPPTTPLEKASAAVLACGPGAALSHASAMTLWGFWRRWDAAFEVSTVKDRQRRGIVVHRRSTLHRRDLSTQLGIRVTSPARTLHDIAPRLDDRRLARAVNDALLSPYLTQSQLAELLQRHPNKRLARFVAGEGGPTRSDLERDFLAFCRRFHLPTPQTNVIVGGYEVDAYFPEHRLIVELDGWAFHSTRRSFESDRDRDADHLSADVPTLRVTHERITHAPGAEAARLQRILETRE